MNTLKEEIKKAKLCIPAEVKDDIKQPLHYRFVLCKLNKNEWKPRHNMYTVSELPFVEIQ